VRLLLQRVSRATVRVGEETVGSIGPGLAILVGVGRDDDDDQADRMARRVSELRIFEDDRGLTNRSLLETGGAALVVSQFTLYADTRRGRRPGFGGAANPVLARRVCERFARSLAELGIPVSEGRFGASMDVELVNRGPFTIWLTTDD
jgi:D-tyrosyl-tRNA(Tyr) deacylase